MNLKFEDWLNEQKRQFCIKCRLYKFNIIQGITETGCIYCCEYWEAEYEHEMYDGGDGGCVLNEFIRFIRDSNEIEVGK